PTAVTAQGAVAGAYLDKERYPVFYRLGSGTQYIKDSNGQLTKMGGAYSWLTGGTVGSLSSYQNGEMISTSSGLVFDYKLNGAMPIYGEAGDSGSPLFAFDTVQNKWVLVGVLTAGNGAGGRGNNWAVIPLDFIGQKFNEDNDAPVTFRTSEGGALEWSFNSSTGAGALTQGTTTYAMHGQQGNDLNAGKNLIFQGQNGQINLKDSVSQGAGSLTFRDNYTVTTSNGSTWTGAGIVVDNGVSVNWQVNGVKGDNLHKIGEGTLTVQGTGINEGGLKVGDGKVVLNQQADNKGQVQAFSSVNIASGRPTVVLTDERQVNPDTVSWGYRGGTLDVNGNSLTFHQLKAADYGAVLANNVDKRATITLDYALRADKVALNGWSESGKGTAGNLYKYNNPYTNTTDYFILKQSTYGYFPTDQSSNATWEFVGHSQGDAQKLVADRFNTAGYLFHGQLKGNLNVDN
ncbi:TPA: autotransporter outer membrane beta-barrel domain-containing protein, partial [Escherichia coli]|nr:autotransporter outer membrane beta-barrel domain-containing protein [Escherichia coli]